MVQARDQFGNKITSEDDANNLAVTVYATAGGQKIPLYEPSVEVVGEGIYKCEAYYPCPSEMLRAFEEAHYASDGNGGEDDGSAKRGSSSGSNGAGSALFVPTDVRVMLSVCVLSITRENILYCPWELDPEDADADTVCCSSASDSKKLSIPTPVSKVAADRVVARLVEGFVEEQEKVVEEVQETQSHALEELARRSQSAASSASAYSVADIASSNKRLFMVESLNKLELTRRRAEDALRKERIKREQERQDAQRRKQVRRVGGGFSIVYSKDV